MATTSVSPGAALLRASRMFSYPAAIPQPAGDWSGATVHSSETATKRFPTRQTVTTTSASRAKGDWGFKRPFPSKTTTKQTIPLIRINQVDSIEQVTDFNPASDHSITLFKFQEMHMPLIVPAATPEEVYKRYKQPMSVFEETSDITAFEPGEEIDSENTRWRFRGPWLAGMPDGDFEQYLDKVVRGQRSKFRTYLRKHMAQEMTDDKRRAALEKGRDAKKIADIDPESISDEVYTEKLRILRGDRIELYRLISRFLDLAPVSIEAETQNISTMAPNASKDFRQTGPYSVHGPPITHPSAGLSYLRTRNFQENHPLYGPQKYHTPIKSRVLYPRHFPSGVFSAVIGTGGFVAQTPDRDATTNFRNADKRLVELDLTNQGGAKKYYDLRSASVDSNGAIKLAVDDVSPPTEMVEKERVGEGEVWKSMKSMPETDSRVPNKGRTTGTMYRVFGSGQSYGLSRERDL